jgi:hypothetical protein
LGVVAPKEVPVKEVKLAAEERRERYIDEGLVAPSDIPVRRPGRPAKTETKPESETKEFEGK